MKRQERNTKKVQLLVYQPAHVILVWSGFPVVQMWDTHEFFGAFVAKGHGVEIKMFLTAKFLRCMTVYM